MSQDIGVKDKWRDKSKMTYHSHGCMKFCLCYYSSPTLAAYISRLPISKFLSAGDRWLDRHATEWGGVSDNCRNGGNIMLNDYHMVLYTVVYNCEVWSLKSKCSDEAFLDLHRHTVLTRWKIWIECKNNKLRCHKSSDKNIAGVWQNRVEAICFLPWV